MKKFDSLKGKYSKSYIELLKAISKQKGISYEDIYSKLPSSELVKKDEEFMHPF